MEAETKATIFTMTFASKHGEQNKIAHKTHENHIVLRKVIRLTFMHTNQSIKCKIASCHM